MMMMRRGEIMDENENKNEIEIENENEGRLSFWGSRRGLHVHTSGLFAFVILEWMRLVAGKVYGYDLG